MRYLHSMIRIRDIDEALAFWVGKLGLEEIRRLDSEEGRYTLIFLAAPADVGSCERDALAGTGTDL